ncbi:MAG: hypothetical protein Q9166_002117 [cf. Caloplaca sp. 2 TL-2023]
MTSYQDEFEILQILKTLFPGSLTPAKRAVRKALASLPSNISDVNTDAWDRILTQKSHQAESGRTVICWLIHAFRSLNISEIQHALAVEEGDESIDWDGVPEIAVLTRYCAGLVIIDAESQQLSLVHPITQEYFEDRKQILFPNGHSKLASTCITYLRMDSFCAEGAELKYCTFKERFHRNPLLDYAVANWGTPVRKAKSADVENMAMSLLQHFPSTAAVFQAMKARMAGPLVDRELLIWARKKILLVSQLEQSPLHVAPYFGLVEAAQLNLRD